LLLSFERTEERVREIWNEEERHYDQRTLATKETEQGIKS